jgi:5'/3'-nucleotidase SurE
MRGTRNLMQLMLVALAAIGAPTVEARELTILLTNDDGYEAPGLTALRDALSAAGHRVVIVAPRTDQSGSSAKISTTPIAYKEEKPGVWAVDGSPADATAVGLAVVMQESPPDLVVSGANRGQNLGSTTNLSGTVGAAVMAVMRGIPAIAVSVGINFDEAAAGFPSTLAAYPDAANFIARLVAQLAAGGDERVLPTNTLLNVNYPARAADTIAGAVWTSLGSGAGYALEYRPGPEPGTTKLAFGPDSEVAPAGSNSDTARFAAGYITVGVLDGNWAASADIARAIAARAGEIVQTPPSAP